MKAVCRILMVTVAACLLGTNAIGQAGHHRPQEFRSFGPSAPMPANREPITCSPAPCVLPPTQGSEGGAEVIDAPIAADPLNAMHLLLGSEDFNCGPSSFSGFHFSKDGGSTWGTHCLPVISAPKLVYLPGGEPMVGYDSNGVAYIGDEYSDNGGQRYGLVALEKSSDGFNWSNPGIALGGPNNHSEFVYAWLAVDASTRSPYANNLYVSAVALNEPRQNKNQVVVSHSSDSGATWSDVALDPVQTSPAIDRFTNLAVNSDGTVYATWMHCPGTGPHANCGHSTEYMLFSKSLDGGGTWSKPSVMTTAIDVPNACMCWPFGPIPNTDVYANNIPVVGVDDSNGPYAGTLYVVAYSWTGIYMRVGVIRSTDGGNSWSKPVPVAPPSANHDQFFPWLSVSSTGLVGVSWLDRRNDPANVNYQAFASISTDGGQSFRSNVQLTSAFSNPNKSVGNMGSYTGNTWNGPDFVAAWMDSSNGVDMQDVVGGIRLH
jgi:hypothetical protein